MSRRLTRREYLRWRLDRLFDRLFPGISWRLYQRREWCYCCRAHNDRLRMRRHPRIEGEWVCGFCWRLNHGQF